MAAERQPHAEPRAAAAAAVPNSLSALGSDYSEDAGREEHPAPTEDAGVKRQRLSEEVAPVPS